MHEVMRLRALCSELDAGRAQALEQLTDAEEGLRGGRETTRRLIEEGRRLHAQASTPNPSALHC